MAFAWHSCDHSGYLKVEKVIAETSVLITNMAETFCWTNYGLKLNIPQGALPAGLEECRLLMKVGLSGQFALPENTTLVSAVYWLDSEPRCKFSKHLTLEIQHCVKPTDTSKLSFVEQDQHLPQFKVVKGGEFSSDSAYGCMQLERFSHVGIVSKKPVSYPVYWAHLYYLKSGVNQIYIHFVITWNAKAHTTVSSEPLFSYCWSLLSPAGHCCRLSNRSTLPAVPQLDQTCQLSLNQIASHCSCLLKELFSKMDGELIHCLIER